MSWFTYALIATLGWGFADLFYKRGTDDSDRYSYLKIAVWVGLVMGACSLVLLFVAGDFSGGKFWNDLIAYTPASVSYIVSMIIGYAGLRYLELSIISPLQNASGAFSVVLMLIFFFVTGEMSSFWDEFTMLDVVGTIFVIVGAIALAVVENKIALDSSAHDDRKYRYGAMALAFPMLYCLFDTIGTAADGIILTDESGMNLSETDVLILYGFTFLFVGILAWLFLLYKTKKMYNPFSKSEKDKAIAACFEQFGQVFYIFAMSARPMLAAPMIASYCIVSVILSRIILKEKLLKKQYACVILVIIGIVILGISEGLAS